MLVFLNRFSVTAAELLPEERCSSSLNRFSVTVAELQLLPEEGSSLDGIFKTLDLLFTVFFALELLANMTGK